MDALRKVGHEMVAEVRKHVSNHIKQGIAKDSIYRDFLENRDEYTISDIEADMLFTVYSVEVRDLCKMRCWCLFIS